MLASLIPRLGLHRAASTAAAAASTSVSSSVGGAGAQQLAEQWAQHTHFSRNQCTCGAASTSSEQDPQSTQASSSSNSNPSSSNSSSVSNPNSGRGLLYQRIQHHQRVFSTFKPGGSAPTAQDEKDAKARWQALYSQSQELNPCNSKLHPAVEAGVIKLEEEAKQRSVQEAYTPKSQCFGCGPANPEGLQLKSYRTMKNGLEAHIRIPAKYSAFPGILNGGILSSLLDCHGNWTAAIALMDRSCLPKPPLTLTQSMFVTYKEPSPPEKELLVQSQVVSVKESKQAGQGRSTVEVQIQVFCQPTEKGEVPKLLVTGLGTFKRLGALRAL